MAKESVNILKDKIDIVDLLAQLNAALSEEWLAFYQYWVGSFVVEGAMRGDVQRESSGDIVVVLEAMKMQSNYKVTSDCTVRDILVNEGDSVNANQVLIVLDIIKED